MENKEQLQSPHKAVGMRRLLRATIYSVEGLGSALKHESAFRFEVCLAAIMLPTAVLLPVGLVGTALMIGSVFLVLITELLNSAIEWVVDLVSLDNHPFAKRSKDMASAAVFLSLFNVVLIWGLVLVDSWVAVSAYLAI